MKNLSLAKSYLSKAQKRLKFNRYVIDAPEEIRVRVARSAQRMIGLDSYVVWSWLIFGRAICLPD